LRTNSLQEGGVDRGLSIDSIQEELKDEPLQFKGPMKRAWNESGRSNYLRLLM